MIRVLHVLDHSLPLHSGYTFRTLAILREQRALGWETIALTSPKQGPGEVLQETVDGWVFHRTPVDAAARASSPRALLAQMRATAGRIATLVDQLKPDVLHPHSPILNAFPALWVARRRRLPCVYELRALWEDAATDHGTTSEQSLRYRLSRALETMAVRAADHVVTICEGLRGEVLGRGVPAERITVVPNAVDIEEFQMGGTPDPALRRKLGLDGRTVLGFAGSFYGYEGLDLLLAAFARLRERRGDLAVLLLGGGPQEARLKEQARALGVEAHVVFTGRVPHAEVPRYYDLIDLLVYPRRSMRLTELVTPLKPLEAMAQGRVFVASDVGGHRELVRDRTTGFLFRADDVDSLVATIDDVLARRDDWERVRQAGRRFVETERNWKVSVGRYRAVYERLLAAGGRLPAAQSGGA